MFYSVLSIFLQLVDFSERTETNKAWLQGENLCYQYGSLCFHVVVYIMS